MCIVYSYWYMCTCTFVRSCVRAHRVIVFINQQQYSHNVHVVIPLPTGDIVFGLFDFSSVPLSQSIRLIAFQFLCGQCLLAKMASEHSSLMSLWRYIRYLDDSPFSSDLFTKMKPCGVPLDCFSLQSIFSSECRKHRSVWKHGGSHPHSSQIVLVILHIYLH